MFLRYLHLHIWVGLKVFLRFYIFNQMLACLTLSTVSPKQQQQFPDLDKMLSGLTSNPKKITANTARVGIDTLIYLKQALKTAPILAEALAGLRSPNRERNNNSNNSRHQRHNEQEHEHQDDEEVEPSSHPLVEAIINNLRAPQLGRMEEQIMEVVTESTAFSKSAHEMRHQECFALRTGIHGLLDVARKTFLQTVEDLYKVPRG